MKRYTDPAWMQSMKLRLDVNNMFLDKHGVQGTDLDKMSDTIKQAKASVDAGRGTGWMGWTELPYNQAEIVKDILTVAADIRGKFENFVVLGIGGSALGPAAVQQALQHLRYNELDASRRGGPKLYVEDNVDPERMIALLDVIDVEKTAFNVITKSGSTSETMTQYLIIWDMLKKRLGDKAKEHIIATTDSAKGNLIKIARAEGFRCFYVPDGVGGRFSELTPVGLLPAAVCGIDIEELLAGAAFMDALCRPDDILSNAALLNAALHCIAMEQGKNISVMMPYADSLKFMADWYAQLWAESLGKHYDLNGKEVYAGQTPVKSLGVTDQHSQVQLYAEGPFDKVVTFLAVDEYRETFTIPSYYEDIPDVSFLAGHTMNELIQAERMATEYAVLKAGKMNCTITLPQVNAFTLGQLMYFFMMQTAYAGAILGVNTFDQPGVEEGKNATYALLGRPGYEEKRQELESRPAKNPKWIL